LPLAGFVFWAIIFQEKLVQEFRVTGASPDGLVRERRIRIALWCAVIFLAGLALFAIFGGRLTAPRINIALAWIAGCAVIGTIVCANFLAFDHGMEKIKRETVFLLTDKELIRRRSGWPDLIIALPEVRVLREEKAWLVVESTEPRRIIRIPAEVNDFEVLRAHLRQRGPVVTSRQRFFAGLMIGIGYLICQVLVFASGVNAVAIVAAVAGLLLPGVDVFRMRRTWQDNPKRFLLWMWFGSRWVTAAAIICLRMARGR